MQLVIVELSNLIYLFDKQGLLSLLVWLAVVSLYASQMAQQISLQQMYGGTRIHLTNNLQSALFSFSLYQLTGNSTAAVFFFCLFYS